MINTAKEKEKGTEHEREKPASNQTIEVNQITVTAVPKHLSCFS